MTTSCSAPSATRDTGLQAEAAQLERLRREIAELATKGEVASPKLLADFARVQKVYLDKKIGIEKDRRNVALSPVSAQPADGGVEAQAKDASPATHEEQAASKSPMKVSRVDRGSPSVFRIAVLWVLLLSAIAAAWYFASHP